MEDIDQTIKREITQALEGARNEALRIEGQYERAKLRVKKLEKSINCKHKWDTGIRGLQVNTDECTKCGWSHYY